MSSWNGMTEPLDKGDRVRIIGGADLKVIGEIHTVQGIITGGYVRQLHTGGQITKVLEPHYIVDIKPIMEGGTNVSYLRRSLWKLPPDWDDVMSREAQKLLEKLT